MFSYDYQFYLSISRSLHSENQFQKSGGCCHFKSLMQFGQSILFYSLIKKTREGSTPRVVSSMFLAQAKDSQDLKTGQGAPKVTINTLMPIFFIHVLLATTLNCFPHEKSLNIIVYNISCISVKMNIAVGKCF